jgi:hypothetical protein
MPDRSVPQFAANRLEKQRLARILELKLEQHGLRMGESRAYWLSQDYRELVGSANRGVRYPFVTETYTSTRDAPVSWSLRPYVLTVPPKCNITHLGWMDPYPFSTNVPKFDPWIRDRMRERDPTMAQYIEDVYLRDPMTPERSMEYFGHYIHNWKPLPKWKDNWSKSLDVLKQAYSCMNKTLRPIDMSAEGMENLARRLDLSSSPGLPFSREYSTQAECLDLIMDQAKRLNHFAKFLDPKRVRVPPYTLGQRPGLTEWGKIDEKNKTRAVWVAPGAWKVVELRFAGPALDSLKRNFGKHPCVIGANLTKMRTSIVDHMGQGGRTKTVDDISHQDADSHPGVIGDSCEVIGGWFDFHHKREEMVWECIREKAINKEVVFPSGQHLLCKGCTPSGSEFTTIIETLNAQRVKIFGLLEQGFEPHEFLGHMFGVGDDQGVGTVRPVDMARMITSVKECEYTIKPESVFQSVHNRDIKFLGATSRGFHDHKTDFELARSALLPESFVGGWRHSGDRIIGQNVACGQCSAALHEWAMESVSHSWFDTSEHVVDRRQHRFATRVLGVEVPVGQLEWDIAHLI